MMIHSLETVSFANIGKQIGRLMTTSVNWWCATPVSAHGMHNAPGIGRLMASGERTRQATIEGYFCAQHVIRTSDSDEPQRQRKICICLLFLRFSKFPFLIFYFVLQEGGNT